MHVIDCGVVLYLTAAGGQTDLVGIDGAVFPAGAFSVAGPPGAWQESAYRSIQKSEIAMWTLHGLLQAGVQSVKVRAEMLRVDPRNADYFAWSSIQTIRSDTGAPAAQHTIAAADLVSVFNTAQKRDVNLQTTDATLCGKVRLIVQAQAAIDSADLIVAALAVTFR